MPRCFTRTLIAVLLATLSLARTGAAANLDQLMQDFQVTPGGLKPAPAFGLPRLDGRQTTLAEQRGRPVLLYFWATW